MGLPDVAQNDDEHYPGVAIAEGEL